MKDLDQIKLILRCYNPKYIDLTGSSIADEIITSCLNAKKLMLIIVYTLLIP